MINLFDQTSTSFTSNAFLLENQVTIFATGLPAAGEVRFEIVTFRDTPTVTANIPCGACPDPCNPGGFPSSEMVVISTQRVTCGSCGTNPNNNQVRLTSASSYIVLDAPIGSHIRAVYVGTGLGTFTVGYSRSDTRDLTPAMRGCCPLVADLRVTKVSNATRNKTGETVVYTVTAVNAGPANANGTKVYDTLPFDFLVDSIVATYANGTVGPAVTTRAALAEVALAVFPSGGTATFTVTGRYALTGYYGNTAKIEPPLGVNDPDLSNNTATAVLVVEAPPPPGRTDFCGDPIDDTTDRYVVAGNLKTCVNGAVVPLTCEMLVRTGTCPEPTIPVPPLDTTPCASPSFVLGESLDGTIRKYARTAANIVTPDFGTGQAATTGLVIGQYGTIAVQTLKNPSNCFPAIAIIDSTAAWQITNDSNSIGLDLEVDIGDGVWTQQSNFLAPRLNNPPAGMSQTQALETSRSIPSVSIPAGGTIVVRTRNKTTLYAAGLTPAAWDSSASQIRALIFVQQVL